MTTRPTDSQPARAIDKYMQQLRRREARLSQEEVVRLARQYRETGDPAARKRLVEANLALVAKIAYELGRDDDRRLELIQEGSLGLMCAVERYDPDGGVRLSTYAAWWIRAYMLRFIMTNYRLIRLGKGDAQKRMFWRLNNLWQAAEAQGLEEDRIVQMIAEECGASVPDVSSMRARLVAGELSLSAMVHGEELTNGRGVSIQDQVIDQAPLAEEVMGDEQRSALLRASLTLFQRTLSEVERVIFDTRWLVDDPRSLKDIGAQYGFSRSWAQLIEAGMLRRLRERLAPVMGEDAAVPAKEGRPRRYAAVQAMGERRKAA